MKKTATSFDLSPAEIKNKDFKKIMLGYSPEEVVGFLDKVAKLWEKVQKREKDLVAVIETLDREIQDWKSKEAELEVIKEKAREEAKKIIGQSEEQAATVRLETEKWLATVLEEVETVEKRKANFLMAFKSALDSHYEILNQEQDAQEPLTSKLQEYLKKPEKRPTQIPLS
ncbi:DivIVA domain-containing protein [bacterium]|nr:DivIVA domain-containing protein [bacterium]